LRITGIIFKEMVQLSEFKVLRGQTILRISVSLRC